ncbi:MAG: hypothetical protein J6S85_14310 [Methanobrevibacter sp.]|nr:hypothetical protein [Methanobrevibacter sp.]
MKTALEITIEANNDRFDKFEVVKKGTCELIHELGYMCSECPCYIEGKDNMECAFDKVQSMLELLDNDLNENKAYNLSQKLGAREYPDCYNTH